MLLMDMQLESLINVGFLFNLISRISEKVIDKFAVMSSKLLIPR